MHTHSSELWTHSYVFLSARHARNERRTWAVVAHAAAPSGWRAGKAAGLAGTDPRRSPLSA